MSEKKKRKAFSVEEKAHIIWRLEGGENNSNIAKEYNVSHSTISTIWKNREVIRTLFDHNVLSKKRLRIPEHKEIDDALLIWFKQQRSFNVPINGPILQQKANDFAERMGKENFQCSSSWIQRFRARHDIVFGKISGESAGVPPGVSDDWLLKTWKLVSDGYAPEDIFNADECGLFFNMTPDKTFKFKGEKCFGGKLSKARITVLVTANMTGSSKEKLLVIGKSKNPRCFKNVSSLPVNYEYNTKAWMTSDIFQKWLRKWDAHLKLKNRKIVLLVDNCPAHPTVPNLMCIKLVFLPPNVTSVLQPMDQGVIKALKTHYRKLLVLHMLQNIEQNKTNTFNVLDAILMISEAWEKVTPDTIANCFSHAGFKQSVTDDEDNDNIPLARLAEQIRMKTTDPYDDDIPLSRLTEQLPSMSLTRSDLEDFINVDKEVAICAQTSEQDILDAVAEIDELVEIDEETEEEEQLNSPTLCEALGAVETLQKFLIFNDKFNNYSKQECLKSMLKEIQCAYQIDKCKKQTKITDFFNQ